MFKIAIKKPLHGAKGKMNLKVNFELKQGEFLAISGESGSGKTTLLRILAGLEESEGFITCDNEVWQNDIYSLPIQARKIGFVFQDYALFENMTVEQNLLFVQKNPTLANRLLSITGMSELKKRYPKTLSGGQKQRLSLCRAFMNQPHLLLMDEPLSALDPQMRTKLQNEILALHQEFGTTTIMVSHEPSEIYRLASRVIVLDQGKIIKDGNIKEVLLSNSHKKDFSFEGEVLEIHKRKEQSVAIVAVHLQLIEVPLLPSEIESIKIGDKVKVGTKEFAPTILK
jgi:molybdate transport system ATP-binding protein